ncbi:hypothetical protein EDF56_103288 [Novosphingobium sp. PhB165]|uniref:hypothetical protein n=1 Tax=Novosphingobium sp. PhB165 TaxID=2485105 RepID=UPI00104E7CBB|nr:hypothetical protein [Novosphingobium sp. PhB165]TCM19645.1 hypothetical protein EDF56_103288 [Novosphingobium sp. PhB165]
MSSITTTISSAFAALTLACLAPGALAAGAPAYAHSGSATPIDLDDTDVLTAHVGMPDSSGSPVDDACREAARASNGGNDGTIVVCSHGADGTDQRVPASKSVDESTRTGAAYPPDVGHLPGCLGPCITIPFGRVPEPVYYIDLKSIPEAPKGSDAWKIGQGELRAR